jgi:Raf kinase inhibitor-like YbhB/YbcL family protein
MNNKTFTLTSTSLGGQISQKQAFDWFGWNGENISPALKWENIPEGTKSFAITVYDKDAPTDSGWWHWICIDLPMITSELWENFGNCSIDLMPKWTIQTRNDYWDYGYGWPCPPEWHWPHQYIFTVHALKVEKLWANKNSSAALISYLINSQTIEKTSLISYFER